MPQMSKWVMHVEKRQYVLTGAEVEAVLNAGNARFVRLKDLVINPAFIQDIVKVEGVDQPPQIESERDKAMRDILKRTYEK